MKTKTATEKKQKVDTPPFENSFSEHQAENASQTQEEHSTIPEVEAESIDSQEFEEMPPHVRANLGVLDEFFDSDYAKSLATFVLKPIEKYYFRSRLIGFTGNEFPKRNNPKRPLIFASNHSGMAFPWDAIIFAVSLYRHNGYDMMRAVRALISPMLSKADFMNPFFIRNFWKRAGGIDATTINFETMMYDGRANILIYPEGVPGIGKGFDKRYQLQRLSTSALRMSLKYETDIIPFATVNAEYINPYSYSFEWLDRIGHRLSIPFIPIGPLVLLILLQPWMFYFAMPARLVFVRGRRIKPYKMIDKPFDELSEEDIYKLRDTIHIQMQKELDEAVRLYGKDPYEWEGLLASFMANISKVLHFIPVAWPFIFAEHERRYLEMKKKQLSGANSDDSEASHQSKEDFIQEEPTLMDMVTTAANTIIENPEVLFMYIPFVGWMPAAAKSIFGSK